MCTSSHGHDAVLQMTNARSRARHAQRGISTQRLKLLIEVKQKRLTHSIQAHDREENDSHYRNETRNCTASNRNSRRILPVGFRSCRFHNARSQEEEQETQTGTSLRREMEVCFEGGRICSSLQMSGRYSLKRLFRGNEGESIVVEETSKHGMRHHK